VDFHDGILSNAAIGVFSMEKSQCAKRQPDVVGSWRSLARVAAYCFSNAIARKFNENNVASVRTGVCGVFLHEKN
jgi:hypothetical protein